jgi:predicted O-methyltransferase YrrM
VSEHYGLPWPRRFWRAVLAAVEMVREPAPLRPKAGAGLAPEPTVEFDPAIAEKPSVPFPERTEGDLNMSDHQLAFIETCAREAPVARCLEIGAYFGTTTCVLAQVAEVTVVDWFRGNAEAGLWAPTEREHGRRVDGFLSNLDRMRVRDRVTVLEGKSGDVVPHLKHERYGLTLVDGDHSFQGARTDIENVWDLIMPGGFLLLDDWSAAPCQDGVRDDVRLAWRSFAAERRLNGGLSFSTPDTGEPKLVAIRKRG